MTGFEYRTYQKDGNIIWVDESSRTVCDNSRKMLYYEGMIQDITHRKRLEQDLKQQLQELQIEIDQQKRREGLKSPKVTSSRSCGQKRHYEQTSFGVKHRAFLGFNWWIKPRRLT